MRPSRAACRPRRHQDPGQPERRLQVPTKGLGEGESHPLRNRWARLEESEAPRGHEIREEDFLPEGKYVEINCKELVPMAGTPGVWRHTVHVESVGTLLCLETPSMG